MPLRHAAVIGGAASELDSVVRFFVLFSIFSSRGCTMSKAVSDTRKSQAAHSWGILLGMLGIPVLALMAKIFPQQTIAWEVLMAVCGLIIIRSTVGYLFPGLGSSVKKSESTVAQTR
jgi:hypothetical protein